MRLLGLLITFTCALPSALGYRRRGPSLNAGAPGLSSIQLQAATAGDCSVPESVLNALLDGFPCLRDRCSGAGGGGGGQTPSPSTTAAPPLTTQGPPSATTTAAPAPTTTPAPPGVTTAPSAPPPVGTTPAPTTEAPVIPPGPPAPGGVAPQFGTYIPNWFVYRKHYMGVERMNVFNQWVDPASGSNEFTFWASHLRPLAPKLTHLYYAFWDLKQDCVIEDVDPDASWHGANPSAPPTWITVPAGSCNGLMNDMMALKSEFPHLKLVISVGGWTFSGNFMHCTATAENRERMWKSWNTRVSQMDSNWGKANGIWDGMDLDWEFPEAPGATHNFGPNDWENYVLTFQLFRTRAVAAGRNHVALGSAIGVGETLTRLIQKPATARAFCDTLDHVALMQYDIHGRWDRTTGHNAPFCIDDRPGNPSQPIAVRATIEAFASAGCDLKKMILGIPNYSHSWTRIPAGPLGNGLFSSATQSPWTGWGTFSDSDSMLIPQGILSFWDLKDTLQRFPDFQVHSWNCPADMGFTIPIRHVYSAQREAFASYEDPETVELKSGWARAKGLGGIFFWDAQQDRHGDLLDAARRGWGQAATFPAAGSRRCFDDSRIDFNKDPITGEIPVRLCQFTNHSMIVRGGDTCASLRESATRTCGGREATVIGGHRSHDQSQCLRVCGPTWGAGEVALWTEDIIHFACAGDTIPPADQPGPSGGGVAGGDTGGGGGQDCATCDRCVAVPGNNQAVSDSQCSPCARGGQTWWPCNLGTGFCRCG